MQRPKTIAIAAVTVDGKIARNNHELVRWTSKEDKEFFRRETARIGLMILGNATYDTFPAPLPNRRHIVMTRSLEGKKFISGQVEFTTDAPQAILEKLAMEGIKEVVIAGGSSIYSLFIKEKVLDELWVTFEPKLFGEGIGVVSGIGDCSLRLLSYEKLNADSLLCKYAINY